MDCPICFNAFKPPIYQCVSGHSFCSDCTVKLTKCPTCSKSMTNTRNFTLESVVDELLRKPCPNFNQGCLHRLFSEEIQEHQKICDHRSYTCPMKSISVCEWSGKRNLIYQHVKEKHHWNNQQRFYTLWSVTHPQYPMSFHYLHGKMFYFYRLLKNQTLYWVMQYIGPCREAKSYHYQLVITKKHSKQRIVLSQVCFDDSLSPDELIDAGLCIGIPVEVIKEYVMRNGKFLCSIEVSVH